MEQFLNSLGIDSNFDKDSILQELKKKRAYYKATLKERLPESIMIDNKNKLKNVSYMIGAIELSKGMEPSFGPDATPEQEMAYEVVETQTIQTTQTQTVEIPNTNDVTPTSAANTDPIEPQVNETETISSFNPSALTYRTRLEQKFSTLKITSIIAALILGIILFVKVFQVSGAMFFWLIVIFALIYFLFNKLFILETVDKKFLNEVQGYSSVARNAKSYMLPIIISLSIPSLILLGAGFSGIIFMAIYVGIFFGGTKLIVYKLGNKFNINSNMVMREAQKIIDGR